MAKVRAYIVQWIELLLAEKRRHMNLTDLAMWPQNLTWKVRKVYDLPIVLWRSKPKHEVPSPTRRRDRPWPSLWRGRP